MPPIGTPLKTREDREDTERLMSWAGFPDLLKDGIPWYQRTAVAIAAGVVAVVALIGLVLAVVIVSDESTRPAAPPAILHNRITTSVTPLPPTPSPSSSAAVPTPPAMAVQPPPIASDTPPADAPPADAATPPDIERESPNPPPNGWYRWLHRMFPNRFPDDQ